MKIKVMNVDYSVQEEIDLELNGDLSEEHKSIFKSNLIRSLRLNKRQGTRMTKTVSMVSGGGKKPWRQKGTGNARQGSTRSPQWRKGATIFGPLPLVKKFYANKKEKSLFLKRIINIKGNQILALNAEEDSKPYKFFEKVKKENGYPVLYIDKMNSGIFQKLKNMQGVSFRSIESLNPLDIQNAATVVINKQVLDQLPLKG